MIGPAGRSTVFFYWIRPASLMVGPIIQLRVVLQLLFPTPPSILTLVTWVQHTQTRCAALLVAGGYGSGWLKVLVLAEFFFKCQNVLAILCLGGKMSRLQMSSPQNACLSKCVKMFGSHQWVICKMLGVKMSGRTVAECLDWFVQVSTYLFPDDHHCYEEDKHDQVDKGGTQGCPVCAALQPWAVITGHDTLTLPVGLD